MVCYTLLYKVVCMALMTKVLDIFKSKQAFVICQECNHKGRFDEFKIEDSIMMHCPHCHYSFNRKRHKISSI